MVSKETIRRRNNAEREHEMKLKILDVMQNDPEMKYYLGVLTGAGIAGIGHLIGMASGTSESDTEEPPLTPEEGARFWAWLIGTGGVGGIAGGAMLISDFDSDPTSATIPGQVGGLIKLAGTGFAGFCATVLILKAIFGENESGQGIISSLIPGPL